MSRLQPTDPGLRRSMNRYAFRDALKRFMPMLVVVMFVSGCETTPQLRSIVRDTYMVEAVGDTQRQTKENITVEDVGEAQEVIQPVEVQACQGPHLLYDKREYIDSEGNRRTRTVRVMETVDPLRGIYIRRLKITNNSEHTLRPNQIDTVLVDGAGNNWDGLDEETLEQNIRAGRPCPSTDAVVRTLIPLKLLGGDTRIRPGRETTLLAAFSGVDKSITGDWVLELNDFPVATNEAAEVIRVTRFLFPLEAKGYRTIIRQRKESLFAPWEEIGRSTEEIVP